MKWVIALWASPLALFWGWFFLSLNDMNFGYIMLTRRAHDLIFELYGQMLGVDPTTIPLLIAKACIVDSLILAAIFAFRRRKALSEYFRNWRARNFGVIPSAAPAGGQVHPAE